MKTEDLNIGTFFTTNGTDVWELKSFCKSPTCTMLNLQTGGDQHFGINGFTADTFHKIEMPEVKK